MSGAAGERPHVSPTESMWNIEDIEAIPVELDFSSSGQGRRSATAIQTGDIRLINAIELVDVEPTATQVEVCECCGYPHCSPGGWVAFRRMGERVVWIPAWDEMAKGAWEETEYRPPSFLQSKGAPAFSSASWEQLRRLHGGLPSCADVPPINSRETARVCQWSAPGRVLGTYPLEPRLRRDLLIAVTNGELAVEASVVDSCLQAHFEAVEQMALVPGDVLPRPIEFWLDLPGTPAWTSFAHVESNVCFLIDANTALVREGGVTRR
jgi:hypothetical protein